MAGTGAVVDFNDPLQRQKWVVSGLIQSGSRSRYDGLIGSTPASPIFKAAQLGTGQGNSVVFDYDGNIAVRAIKGKNKARGTGERSKKFNSQLGIERYRFVHYVEDVLDASSIADLSLAQLGRARRELSDSYTRWKDQQFIDVLQGLHYNSSQPDPTPTHTIDLTSFDVGELEDIELTLKTGTGFSTGGIRRPIEPFYMENGEEVWILEVDSYAISKLKKSPNYRTLIIGADVRGNNNRAIKGVVGKLGHLLIKEAPTFMGEVLSQDSLWGADEVIVEMSGYHLYDKTNDKWTGQEGFDYGAELYSRGAIYGANSIHYASGLPADFKYKPSEDFDIDGELALITYNEFQRVRLKNSSGGDYRMAKVANMDANIVNVNIKL